MSHTPSFSLDSDRTMTFCAVSESARTEDLGPKYRRRTNIEVELNHAAGCASLLTVCLRSAGDPVRGRQRVQLHVDAADLAQLGATIQRAISAALAEQQIEEASRAVTA